MRKLALAAGLLILLTGLAMAPHGAFAELFGNYVGYQSCAECHPEVAAGWKSTRHAAAFETLAEQGQEKLTNPGCVRCHVVAMDDEGGFIDADLTPELKGVQCECCHGPGKAHAESQDPADIKVRPDEQVCRICHTEGQDKNFNFDTKSKLVHGH